MINERKNTRFAPSPINKMHIAHAWIAYFNKEIAKNISLNPI